ncbi:MAG: flagellar hook-length control protein FliK [Planctomycetes bacterium]|nr:flagellar hook-length control protein FliK [Planctomycetota bacterium]
MQASFDPFRLITGPIQVPSQGLTTRAPASCCEDEGAFSSVLAQVETAASGSAGATATEDLERAKTLAASGQVAVEDTRPQAELPDETEAEEELAEDFFAAGDDQDGLAEGESLSFTTTIATAKPEAPITEAAPKAYATQTLAPRPASVSASETIRPDAAPPVTSVDPSAKPIGSQSGDAMAAHETQTSLRVDAVDRATRPGPIASPTPGSQPEVKAVQADARPGLEPESTPGADAATTGTAPITARVAAPTEPAARAVEPRPTGTGGRSETTSVAPGASAAAPAGQGPAEDQAFRQQTGHDDPRQQAGRPAPTAPRPVPQEAVHGLGPVAGGSEPAAVDGAVVEVEGARSDLEPPTTEAIADPSFRPQPPTSTQAEGPVVAGGEVAPIVGEPVDAASRPIAVAQPAATSTAPRLEELVDQLSVQVKPGVSRVSFIVDPPELGRVTVRLLLRRGRLVGEIQADHRDVARTLEQGLDALKHSLRQQGLQVDSLRVQQENVQPDDSGTAFADRRAGSDGGWRERSEGRADRQQVREESARSKRMDGVEAASGRLNLMA